MTTAASQPPRVSSKPIRRCVEGGWVGLAGDPAYGGQGLPLFVGASFSE